MRALLLLLLLAVPAFAQGDGRTTASLHATANLQSAEEVAALTSLRESPTAIVCSFYSLKSGCTLAEVRLRYCYLTGSGGTNCLGNHEVIDFSSVAPTFIRGKARVPEVTPTPKVKSVEKK